MLGMDRRTVITLGIILAVILGAFAFLIFNPTAQQAMQKNIKESAKQMEKPPGQP